MNDSQKRATLAGARADVRFDDTTRQLFATDGSIYQVEPFGVAFPQGPEQAQELVALANEVDVPVIPRGGGTGLAGGCLGRGLVVDFSRRNMGISDLNVDGRTVRVGPGVILDQLNSCLAPHGLRFGPDVATSSRATLGGMIANNSSGSHCPMYGTTAHHVSSLDILMADGRIERVGAEGQTLGELADAVTASVLAVEREIRNTMPPGIRKRWHGYGLLRYLENPGDLVQMISGSEGTLAAIVSAELRLVETPKEKGIGLVFFDSVKEAMAATVAFADLKPAAIEHIDRVLFDQTKGKPNYKAARALMELDAKPCESILIVEFVEDVDERLAELAKRDVGTRKLTLRDKGDMKKVWAVRKAGLALLMGTKGPAKPVAGIEDVAVRPEQLPGYVEALSDVMNRLGLDGSYYGHAASGLLHVRPVVDLHDGGEIDKFRTLGEEVSAIVKEFKGSIAGEHGVGIARTEFLSEHLGPELMEMMGQIKLLFDPTNRFNPGKIVPDGRFTFDGDLRWGAGHAIRMPFEPILKFALKDEGFLGNLEQCNGNGACRKYSPTMCPTYIATGEEIMSTRGRANAIRASLEARVRNEGDRLRTRALDEALSNCISCKACTYECPSNVNMALLKAEIKHAQHKQHGIPLGERALGSVDLMGYFASFAPKLANSALKRPWFRKHIRNMTGMTDERPLPKYARQSFDRWFRQHKPNGAATRGDVILWDDTFTRYNDPRIGRAAVAVLEAAGFRVQVVRGRKCCGRPAFSLGMLDRARKLAVHNLKLVSKTSAPIVFLEPSCFSMFYEDYRELDMNGAETVAKRSILFEEFIENLLEDDPNALQFADTGGRVAIHAHCHAKSILDIGFMERLASRVPNSDVHLMNTGCCGMAGSFGYIHEKAPLSLHIAQPLVQKVQDLHAGTYVVASGTSCRSQIDELTDVRPVHMAELLAASLAGQQ